MSVHRQIESLRDALTQLGLESDDDASDAPSPFAASTFAAPLPPTVAPTATGAALATPPPVRRLSSAPPSQALSGTSGVGNRKNLYRARLVTANEADLCCGGAIGVSGHFCNKQKQPGQSHCGVKHRGNNTISLSEGDLVLDHVHKPQFHGDLLVPKDLVQTADAELMEQLLGQALPLSEWEDVLKNSFGFQQPPDDTVLPSPFQAEGAPGVSVSPPKNLGPTLKSVSPLSTRALSVQDLQARILPAVNALTTVVENMRCSLDTLAAQTRSDVTYLMTQSQSLLQDVVGAPTSGLASKVGSTAWAAIETLVDTLAKNADSSEVDEATDELAQLRELYNDLAARFESTPTDQDLENLREDLGPLASNNASGSNIASAERKALSDRLMDIQGLAFRLEARLEEWIVRSGDRDEVVDRLSTRIDATEREGEANYDRLENQSELLGAQLESMVTRAKVMEQRADSMDKNIRGVRSAMSKVKGLMEQALSRAPAPANPPSLSREDVEAMIYQATLQRRNQENPVDPFDQQRTNESVRDLTERIATLTNQVEKLQAMSVQEDLYHSIPHGSQADVRAFIDSEMSSDATFGLFIDFRTALQWFSVNATNTDAFVSGLHKQQQAGLLNQLEAQQVASFASGMAPCLGGGTENLDHPLPKVATAAKFQGNGRSSDGFRRRSEGRLLSLEKIISREAKGLKSAAACALALRLFDHTRQFMYTLFEFMSRMFRELTMDGTFTAKEAWHLVCLIVVRILNELVVARSIGQDAVRDLESDRKYTTTVILHAVLRAHDKMEEFMKTERMEDHPAVASEMMMFALHARAGTSSDTALATNVTRMNGILDGLSTAARSHGSRLDALYNRVNKLETNSGGGGGNRRRGGGKNSGGDTASSAAADGG